MMVLNKKTILSILMVTAMLLTAAFAFSLVQTSWAPQPVQAADEDAARKTITVTGSGEIEVEPDVAYISFGVMAKAPTAEEAQKANAATFAKIEKVLYETYKLNKKDVQTSGFYVHADYRYADKEEPKIAGYTATHQVQVTFRKLDQIGALLDAVSKAGANQINNIQFATEKTEEVELEALKKAMKNARAKAEVLAEAEGQKIKGLVHVTQSAGYGGPIYGPSFAKMAFDEAASADSAGTSISRGEVKVRMQVTVQYEF